MGRIRVAPEIEPFQGIFKVADELLLQTICGLTEMLTRAGLVNVDYADLRTILDEGGVSLIGVGESEGAPMDRMEEAVRESLTSPLLGSIDLKDAKGALVRVVGGPDMTIEEAAKAAVKKAKDTAAAKAPDADALQRDADDVAKAAGAGRSGNLS